MKLRGVPEKREMEGVGVTEMAPLFPAANLNFDVSVWVPMVSRRAKLLFSTGIRDVCFSHALSLKSKSFCQ